MLKSLGQKLIIISGSPWVGKTTVADNLFYSYENSAHLDDDWVWRVNPFSFDDPRNHNINKNMSFVLSTYLNLNFSYVILSSVRMISQTTRESVLKDITAKDYMTVGFTLTCSEETLMERHKNRGDKNEVSFEWLRLEHNPNDYVINTDNKSVTEIVNEIRSIIDQLNNGCSIET
jgi:broad-specificity NMP kinase